MRHCYRLLRLVFAWFLYLVHVTHFVPNHNSKRHILYLCVLSFSVLVILSCLRSSFFPFFVLCLSRSLLCCVCVSISNSSLFCGLLRCWQQWKRKRAQQATTQQKQSKSASS